MNVVQILLKLCRLVGVLEARHRNPIKLLVDDVHRQGLLGDKKWRKKISINLK